MIPDNQSGSFPKIREHVRWGLRMLPGPGVDIIKYPVDNVNERPEGFVPVYSKAKKQKTEPKTALPSLGERIRTSGLLNPIQARYQTAPHPGTADGTPQQMTFYQIRLLVSMVF